MRKLFSIFLIANLLSDASAHGQRNNSDTVFISKDSRLGTAQSIFIDHDRDNKYYERISRFYFEFHDSLSYKLSLEYFGDNKINLVHQKPVIPWKNWIRLVQYKKTFYNYHPCDFLFHFRNSINDSTFIDWTGEGPIANKIIEQRKIDENTFEFKLTGIYDKDRLIRIHIIDDKKGIAVFEQISAELGKSYYLMISSEKIKSLPIIVNNCKTRKQLELEFEEPDHLELVTGK